MMSTDGDIKLNTLCHYTKVLAIVGRVRYFPVWDIHTILVITIIDFLL